MVDAVEVEDADLGVGDQLAQGVDVGYLELRIAVGVEDRDDVVGRPAVLLPGDLEEVADAGIAAAGLGPRDPKGQAAPDRQEKQRAGDVSETCCAVAGHSFLHGAGWRRRQYQLAR